MVTLTRDFKVLEPAPDEIRGCPKYDRYKRPINRKTNNHYKVKDLGFVWSTHEVCINLGSYLFISTYLVSWYLYLWRYKLTIWFYRNKPS